MSNRTFGLGVDVSDLPQMLTVVEAALVLGMHPHTIFRKIREGAIPCVRPSRRRVYLERKTVLRLLEKIKRGERV